MNNFTSYHVHSDYSLLDSCTKFNEYVELAKRYGQTSLGSTEHGNVFNFVKKKQACEKNGIKYLHGCEVYLTEKLIHSGIDERTGESKPYKVRDNYHTILIAKNFQGVKEINSLVSLSNTDSHFYFKPRISFDEFLGVSDNVIKISACLASPLNRNNLIRTSSIYDSYLDEESKKYQEYVYDLLCQKYDYFEIQPHINSDEQKEYNDYLSWLSKKYGKPLIAAGDFHSSSQYKAECRSILQKAKRIEFSNEDTFDLAYKPYEEFVSCFEQQASVSSSDYMSAIENTNIMADSVEDFVLDTKIKYPHMYDDDDEVLTKRVYDMFHDKLDNGVIPQEQKEQFESNIEEELRVFKKTNMCGFMLSMSEIVSDCKNNGIAFGFARGSCGGSSVAYVTDIIDVNPVQWRTVFSRFCNEDRVEVGDIDVDVYKDDRDFVYDYIINKFGKEKTAHVLALGTVSDKGTIDEIGRALDIIYKKEHGEDSESPYSLKAIAKIKEEYDSDADKCRKNHPDVFKYFDGIVNTYISQSMHPAGIIASPITLRDNYGTLINDGIEIIQLDMDCCHDIGLCKYDVLGLRQTGIIKKTYEYLNKKFPKSHEVDFCDKDVWDDMKTSPIGIFQFEEDYAFSMLKDFGTASIEDMSLVTAMIRPSGASYRNELIKKKYHKNPSEIIDNLLKLNYGYLVYQEDTIAFLQKICGLTGSEADNVRRAIGHKDIDRLNKAMPSILEGYCNKSDKQRDVAEQEAKEFLKVIEDSASYQFGYNHSVAYCMLGYMCAYLRYYYPVEFITAMMNCSETEKDFIAGQELANQKGIKFIPPKFRHSKAEYFFDKENNSIYKGTSSVKFLNSTVSDELYSLRNNKYESFIDLLLDLQDMSINSRQLEILIRLDYFSEFGNAKTLLKIKEVFELFKCGKAKQISKEKLSKDLVMYEIVSRHSNQTDKQFNKMDCNAIMQECEQYITALKVCDFGFREKIKDQKEYIGSISIKTGKIEDRPKIVILEQPRVMKSKNDNKPWGVIITGQSLGSGKKTQYTIPYRLYEEYKLKQDDIINIKRWHKNKSGYFYIDSYELVV